MKPLTQELESGQTISIGAETILDPSEERVFLNDIQMTPDEAIQACYDLLRAAQKADPLAEAKFRGLEMLPVLLRKVHLIKKWEKLPGFKKVRRAYAKQHGFEPEEWDVAQFFLSGNFLCTTKRNGRPRSPLEELRRGSVADAMRAAELDGEMGS